jgi:hypothetical protein
MLAIAMTSSYLVLHPAILNIDGLVKLSPEHPADSSWLAQVLKWLGTPDMQTAYLVLFDGFVGFVCLELLGITKTLQFHRRYNPVASMIAGGLLIVALAGFAFYEAKLTYFSNTLATTSVCLDQTVDQNHCPPTVPRTDPRPTPRELTAYDLSRAKASMILNKMPLDFAVGLAMPFVLMIVGLAFDFFEELYLPASSGVSAIVRASAAVLAFAAWLSTALLLLLFAMLNRLLSHPLCLFVLLAATVAYDVL